MFKSLGSGIGALVLSLALVAACGGKKDDAASKCPAMSVTVDGKALSLPKTMATKDSRGGLLVTAFSHDKVTCKELLAPMRTTVKGEVDVRAYATIKGKGMFDGISTGAYTKGGIGENLKIAGVPKKVGDKASICVSKVEIKPTAGAMKGKTMVVEGLFTGEYCGETK